MAHVSTPMAIYTISTLNTKIRYADPYSINFNGDLGGKLYADAVKTSYELKIDENDNTFPDINRNHS